MLYFNIRTVKIIPWLKHYKKHHEFLVLDSSNIEMLSRGIYYPDEPKRDIAIVCGDFMHHDRSDGGYFGYHLKGVGTADNLVLILEWCWDGEKDDLPNIPPVCASEEFISKHIIKVGNTRKWLKALNKEWQWLYGRPWIGMSNFTPAELKDCKLMQREMREHLNEVHKLSLGLVSTLWDNGLESWDLLKPIFDNTFIGQVLYAHQRIFNYKAKSPFEPFKF